MKLKYQFVLEPINGEMIAAAVGRDNQRFSGMIRLNSGGEVIFRMLQTECTQEEVLARFAAHFGIDEETARPSVLAFLTELRQNDLLVE